MLVTWCIFYRSNLAGTYGTFYQSYEISDLDFLYFFHLERLDFIALIKCTICFSKVAPVEDAQCDQHGIHLNFGPLFAKQFIERTCSLLLLARKEQLRSIKCLANNGPKLRWSPCWSHGASSTVATSLEHTVHFIKAMKYQILIFSRVSGSSI